MKKEIYTTYAPDTDITFIMEDTYNKDNELILTEVKGFYYGKPNEENTEMCYGDLKADFDWGI